MLFFTHFEVSFKNKRINNLNSNLLIFQVYCPSRRPVPAAGEKPGIQVSSGNPGTSGHYSTKNIPTRPKELKH